MAYICKRCNKRTEKYEDLRCNLCDTSLGVLTKYPYPPAYDDVIDDSISVVTPVVVLDSTPSPDCSSDCGGSSCE